MKHAWLPLIVVASCARAPSREAELRALSDTLIQRGVEDQAGRDQIARAVASNDTVFLKRLVATDSARWLWLREIIRKYGWPGRALVGDSAAKAAWLILQHTQLAGFQEEMLPVLDSAAQRGDMPKQEVALLTDRVRVRQKKGQIYGGSFSMKDGKLIADSIDDITHVDERRAAIGLPPMAEYARVLGEVYKVPVVWPPKR
jgi:hypothetical protein